ncbi:UbiA family prenyltransferase [candidate division TA06 bacterium]|uniref:UbiA family prenyltransferase n=1 Tax=candidate division TA06 bacterium TaxID=2250710 RepID=A0A933IC62_UNCT6|nr:UbiA family prenyltransferase [candidate division TA06 bacterium]
MKDKKLNILDYFFVLRPILLAPAWTMLLVGHYQAERLAGTVVKPLWLLPPRLWLALAIYSGLMGAVYIVNQIFDIKTDRLNKKLFLVAEGYVSKTGIWAEAGILMVLALVLSVCYFSRVFAVMMLVSGILGLLYSAPPFKFKAKPFLDMAANAFGYGGLAFTAGWLVSGEYSEKIWLAAAPYMLAVAAVYVNTTIPDYRSDKATGNITTGVFLGGTSTIFLGLCLMAASAGLAYHLNDRLCLIAAGCALPLFLTAVITQKMRWTMLSYQGGSLALALLVGLMYPVFFLLLGATYLALKVYHKKRFGMDYPRFADRG